MANSRPAFGTGVIPDWFHGVIPRKTAEELLTSKPRGYFLIRVSESRPGYTLSYRAEDRCRHFMIDATEVGGYLIVGEKRCHRSLQDLVDFHRRTPIVPYTEVLTVACGKDAEIDYAELRFPQRRPGLQPNSSLLPGSSGPFPPKEVPPALPYRSDIPRNPEVQDPHATLKRYKADDIQPSTSPEVSLRNVVPQPKQNQAAIFLPPNPSIPPPAEDQVGINTDAGKNLAVKPSLVPNIKMLNKIFQTKKGRSQELADTEYEEVAGERTLDGPRVLRTHPGLPQEYLPPPPFAPGY